jgi:post-segregation antitoxin (ccd killing protein)
MGSNSNDSVLFIIEALCRWKNSARKDVKIDELAQGTVRHKPTNVPAQMDMDSEPQPERWIEENRKAFAEYDGFVEVHGVFSEGRRLF